MKMSTSIKIIQCTNDNAEKGAKKENQEKNSAADSEGEEKIVPVQNAQKKPINQLQSATNQIPEKRDLREDNYDDDVVHELFKISSSKELKCSEDETSSEAIETVRRHELNEKEKLEEELRRADFMIRNRKQSLIELETYRSNLSLTPSDASNGSTKNSKISITFSSSSCESVCEKEGVEPKNSEQTFLSNLRQMMPSFHLIGDIDQRLAQLNINSSGNSHDADRVQCDLVLQALDVLTKQGIKPSALSSPYPITKFLFETNDESSF